MCRNKNRKYTVHLLVAHKAIVAIRFYVTCKFISSSVVVFQVSILNMGRDQK